MKKKEDLIFGKLIKEAVKKKVKASSIEKIIRKSGKQNSAANGKT